MIQPIRLPRSIATVSLSGSLPEKLEAAARAGFDGVEIFDNDLMTHDGSPAEVRRIAEDLGLAALPAPARYDGFEFLEFAVDEQARAELASWLAARIELDDPTLDGLRAAARLPAIRRGQRQRANGGPGIAPCRRLAGGAAGHAMTRRERRGDL